MVHDPYWDLVNEPDEPAFDPHKTALLIVDMQNMCGHPDGWMGRLARDAGKPQHLQERFDFMQEITPNLVRLMDFCRTTGVEIFHVRIAFKTATTRDGKRGLLTRLHETPLVPFDFEILDAIAPRGDEIVLDKTSVSTFTSTPIDQILRNMGRDRVWTAGCVTEGCVELTTRDAADRGYATTIVTDCCASSTHAAHDDAVQRITDGNVIRGYRVDQLRARAGL
jgi:nicotinamidase-related amidase